LYVGQPNSHGTDVNVDYDFDLDNLLRGRLSSGWGWFPTIN
jgi:hypothetical protein